MDESAFDEVDLSIRTVSSILYKTSKDDYNSIEGGKLSSFLRHFTMLLTTDYNCDIGVTGSVSAEDGVQAIVLVQTSGSPSSSRPDDKPFKLFYGRVPKAEGKSFVDIIKAGYARQVNSSRKSIAETEMAPSDEDAGQPAKSPDVDPEISNLLAYISDLLALFPLSAQNKGNLIRYVHSHSVGRISARLNVAYRRWGRKDQDGLIGILRNWEVSGCDRNAGGPFSVQLPSWVASELDQGLIKEVEQKWKERDGLTKSTEPPQTEPREETSASTSNELKASPTNTDSEKSDDEKPLSTEVGFSLVTAPIWAKIIASLLENMRSSLDKYLKFKREFAMDSPGESEKIPGSLHNHDSLIDFIAKIHTWSYLLSSEKTLVKTLLGIRSLTFRFSDYPDAELGDVDTIERREIDDTRREMGEKHSDTVFRYLKSLTAWKRAISSLTIHKFQESKILDSVSVHFVHSLSRSKPTILPIDEVNARVGKRERPFYKMRDLKEEELPSSFQGSVHAEAAMIGLVKYLNPESPAQPDTVHPDMVPQLANLRSIPEAPITKQPSPPTVSAINKCCFCCHKLSSILSLTSSSGPGSHGLIYPWSAPRIGISVDNLKRLEEDLWYMLDRVLHYEPEDAYDWLFGGISENSYRRSLLFNRILKESEDEEEEEEGAEGRKNEKGNEEKEKKEGEAETEETDSDLEDAEKEKTEETEEGDNEKEEEKGVEKDSANEESDRDEGGEEQKGG